MGSQESQQISYPKTSVIHHLRAAIRLNIKDNHTQSFLNRSFAVNLNRSIRGVLPRNLNPFCVLQLQKQNNDTSQWTQCCMISPIMALASFNAIYLKNKRQKIVIVVKGIANQDIIQSAIENVIIIEKLDVCLLVLNRPIWQLGWAGIKYLKNQKQVEENPFRSIYHPSRVPSQNISGEFIYQQVLINVIVSNKKQFTASYKGNKGSLIFQIIQLKPYIVGFQKNQNQVFFFNEQSFKHILNGVQSYLKNQSVEKQILKSIDIQKFQIQTQW